MSAEPAPPPWEILSKADLSNSDGLGFQGIWEPKTKDVLSAITQVRAHLASLEKKTKDKHLRDNVTSILDRWDIYACQVVGHTKNGKRLIHINFFPKRHLQENRQKSPKSYVRVFDGGSSFWRIEYNPETKTCSDFSVNGVA